ncbi:MAG: acetate--CoA ligase family protein [Betaproteobacteria bacterium]|nr:acetate--CoA ligase family protein [Betaproteobacteria bacterium]MBI3057197.1 acetate--CoA ligase family protein [Betaproteobacteria bacterium]
MNDLSSLLSPRSIAILGASSDFRKVNGRPLKYLLEKGYTGSIYPVNPKYSKLGALDCYPSVAALPEPVDLAIVAVPARFVAAALDDLGRNGAKAAIVFSSGFAETGPAGRALEQQVVAAARVAGLRLCGPNCLGLINAFERVIATFGQFADGDTAPGPVGFVTQSGAFGTAIAALARQRALGLGYFVNTGNEGDVTFVQVMREVLADSRIRVGAGYIEGLREGAGLIELADAALASGKPLVLAKVGRSEAGARAAASHTGALAGADAVFDGVIRQHGIVRARNEEHMLDMVEAFACCALPQGNGLAIITQSGGAGVLMADRAEELELSVPMLGETTRQALQQVIPEFGACDNPVDITGQFVAEPGLLRESVRIVLSDPQVHIGIVWLQLMDAYVDSLVMIFEELKSQVSKPFIVCWVAAPEKALRELRARGIAVLRGAEPAVDAAAALMRYAEARRNWCVDQDARIRLGEGAGGGELVFPATRGPVSTALAARLLQASGVTLAKSEHARNADAAVACAERLGYPVALKIESPDIVHKTEAKGVRLDLRDAAAVKAAFADITANAKRCQPDAAIDGVIVQAMIHGDVELVVGLKHDPVFGMVIMVGLGGIYVEVLKDVVFRKAPVTEAQAGRMLEDLKSRAILDGVRGSPAVDRVALTRLISAVSLFGVAAGERLQELDLNPVLAGGAGATAVDWLMVCN